MESGSLLHWHDVFLRHGPLRSWTKEAGCHRITFDRRGGDRGKSGWVVLCLARGVGSGHGRDLQHPSVARYPDGSEVALSATPSTNFIFANWSGNLAGNTNPAGIVLDGDKSVTANFLSPYQSWRTGYFTPQEISSTQLSAPASDPDADGLQNLLEYALNLHPREASVTGLPSVGVNEGNLTLTYQKDTTKTDISYQLEVSGDLTAWLAISDELISTNGMVETRRAGVPINGARKFLRLKITQLF